MLQFQVTNKRDRQKFDHTAGPIEFGRGPRRDPMARFVIQDDLYVSKDHVRVEETPVGQIKIENLSSRNPIWLGDNTTIAPGQLHELPLPVRLTVGETVINIEQPPADPISRDSLATIAKPVRVGRLREDSKPSLLRLGDTPNPETLTHWFETVISVQRAAAGSPEFYEQTAQAVIDLVGLDRGMILLKRGEQWETVAQASKGRHSDRGFSSTILQHMVQERRTFYQSAVNASVYSSLQDVEAVVASPVFDSRDQVAGAIYGTRTRISESRGLGIGPLEAQVVQLLASAIGAGLARLEQEAEASRLRVQFEQFFSPDLAHELQRNPRLLEGQEREVTILFSDIRGFSRLSERMEPQEICRLIREVMGMITGHVRNHDGVVVDYAGDGLMAMWNAPADQADHALLACRAALAVLEDVPRLSEQWKDRLGSPLAVGLGINTGPALVGNTGSEQKFKYGPLGHTVNLASRVEGATKQLGIHSLITGSTRALIGDQLATRRLCKVRVVGISGAVELYELHARDAANDWRTRRDTFETALALYEAGQWAACCRAMYPLLDSQEGNYDIPSLNLVTRSIECLKSPPKAFDPVLELDRK